MNINEAIKYLTLMNPKHIEVVELVDRQEVYDNAPESLEAGIKALEEIQQYRAIGTLDECRAAVEKQRARKTYSKNNGWSTLTLDYCPTCNESVLVHADYCENCGQALLWE